MSLRVKSTAAIDSNVKILFPEDGSRLDGFVKCKFLFKSQDQLDALQERVRLGEVTPREQFREMVAEIQGLPDAEGKNVEGDAAFDWLETHEFGGIVRSAIFADYMTWITEGRAKNSRPSPRR